MQKSVIISEKLHTFMYPHTEHLHSTINDFQFPNGFHLNENNRWVILRDLIPWAKFEEEYASLFDEKIGAPAKSFQIAMGALIIQQILKTTDRETLEQIKENPHLQYFLGLSTYEYKAPFNSSMLVYFRQRIKPEIINKINEDIVKIELDKQDKKKEENQDTEEKKERIKNKGQLMLDATVIPSDITYPTDLGLLNQGRKFLEKIIDKLYKPVKGQLEKKPRTDRKKARKAHLVIAKKKKITTSERRKAIKKQLRYVSRNLDYIEELKKKVNEEEILSRKEREKIEIVRELNRQQKEMYEENKRTIENRIVSIEQPHIRPIVRGKARASVEFGAKISVSYVEGYVFLDYVEWSNFPEAKYLKEQVEKYYKMWSYYPESIHVDKIYRTKEKRKYCQEKGIRMGGPKLGRPIKNISNEEKKQSQLDERIRSKIEGKFGEVKRNYGLNLIRTKLKETFTNSNSNGNISNEFNNPL
nr:IS5 family transposase [Geminocystis sp. GBBB08]